MNPGYLTNNTKVRGLWKNCDLPDPDTVCFPSKGAERQGLLIADPQQLKGVVMTGLSELSSQDPEAPEPDSDDDTKGTQQSSQDETVVDQLPHLLHRIPRNCLIQREISPIL